ncbi:MAG: helix-turn-helix domain-containing protein [Ruminococcus sp.]|nr:helix-turn-helix domain-containing protein [Ruminococcus sp.]
MIKDRIKAARLNRNVSMRQAALDMGFPYTTYVNYEKGVSEPNSEALVKIAVYYNISADYLIGMDEAKDAAWYEDATESIMEDIEVNSGRGLRHPLSRLHNIKYIPITDYIAFDEGDTFFDPKDYAPCNLQTKSKMDDYCYYEVTDDLMAPFFEIGDFLLVNMSNRKLEENEEFEGYYVLSIDGKKTIPRRIVFNGSSYKIITTNPYYPPFSIDFSSRSRIIIAGKIERVERLL